MNHETASTVPDDAWRRLPALTAAIVTIATFAKSFIPFYLIGSTPIFAASCALGLLLVVLSWRQLCQNALYVTDILVAMAILYGVVAASFLVNSIDRVPATDLVGILVFHALFVVFGLAAVRALKAVFFVLLTQAAIYLAVLIQYVIRVGDPIGGGYLQDIFDLGPSMFITTVHQQIGTSLSLAVLAMLGFGVRKFRLFGFAALPFVFAILFHLASRTALVALACSLFFLIWGGLWTRSRTFAIATVVALLLSAVVASSLFYRFALHDTAVSPVEADAISRTIKEIQSDDPGFRLPIWERTWDRIVSDPRHWLLGKGVGSFAIDEGVGAPDWLLRKTEGARYSPHNIHLDMLYESGALATLIFTIVVAFPLVVSLRYWTLLTAPERSAIAMYVFWLVSEEIGGSFAYAYDFQFFLALAIGVISLKRKELAEAARPPSGLVAETPIESPI
jgi:hypothetical protein